jgi:hypothetical protein
MKIDSYHPLAGLINATLNGKPLDSNIKILEIDEEKGTVVYEESPGDQEKGILPKLQTLVGEVKVFTTKEVNYRWLNSLGFTSSLVELFMKMPYGSMDKKTRKEIVTGILHAVEEFIDFGMFLPKEKESLIIDPNPESEVQVKEEGVKELEDGSTISIEDIKKIESVSREYYDKRILNDMPEPQPTTIEKTHYVKEDESKTSMQSFHVGSEPRVIPYTKDEADDCLEPEPESNVIHVDFGKKDGDYALYKGNA